MIKVCERCGKMIDASKHGQRKWCDDCRKAIKLECNRQYRQRRAKSKSTVADYAILPQPKTYTCRDCGEKFTSVERTTVCPECKRIQLEEMRRRKNEQLIRMQSKSVKTLTDWIREAADCNLDYGTYRALRSAGKSFEELKALADNRPRTFHSHCRIFK